MTQHCPFDDLSSIESSTCRISKHKDEVISAQKAMILSLSDAVNRLTYTLQSREEELKEEKKVRERTESDLESKNLHLLLENVELKNRVADLQDGFSSNLGQASTKPLPTSPPKTAGPCSMMTLPIASSRPTKSMMKQKQTQSPKGLILSPPKLPRRKSMMNLSNLNITSRFRNPNPSGASSKLSTAQSLFTSMAGKKIAWNDKRPKLIPRNIFFPAELVPVPDEMSDVSA
jgi:FtsZ-binding cell division protein ZapB